MSESAGEPPSPAPGGALGERIVGTLFTFRWPALLGLLLLTVAAGLGAAGGGVDNAVHIWFVDDDPALVAYQEFQSEFGNDEVVVIGVEGGSEQALDADGWRRLAALQDLGEELDGIAEIRTVGTIPTVDGDLISLEIGPVGPEDLEDPDALAAATNRVVDDPVLGPLTSEDGRMTVAFAEMEAADDIDIRRDGILAELYEEADHAAQQTDGELSYAGIGVVYSALNQASTVGAAAVMAGSYVVLLGILWALYGRIGAVVLTLGVVGVGAVQVLGLYGGLGRDINMVTLVLPTLVLVIGVSDCVHMLTHVAQQDPSLPAPERVRRGVGFVLWPCLVNTLTTATGFIALTTSQMPVVRDLGWFSAAGMVAAFVAATVCCTAFATWAGFLPNPDPRGLLQRGVDALAELAVTRPVPILVVAAFVCLGSALGATRLVADTWSIDYLRASHETRQDSQRIEALYGAYTPLEFVIEAPEGVRDAELLAAVDAWQDRLEADFACPVPAPPEGLHVASPCVSWTRSATDGLSALHTALGGEGALPSDPSALEQLLFVYESDPDHDLERWFSEDETRLRVTLGIPMDSARGFGEALEVLGAQAELPDGTELRGAGYLPLYVRMMDYIVASQVRSFGLAFIIVFVLIAVLFRSARLAALAMPANLLPVLTTLGLMGLLGIRLDVATVTIAAIVLGLVVDDTIQLLYRLRHEEGRHAEPKEAIRAAVAGVGRPMAITTLVLGLGFSVLGFAAIKSVAWFGLLLATALFSALLSDLLVIPALLVLTAKPVQPPKTQAS